MMNDQQHEDYDVSNRVINEYLNDIGISKSENIENESTKINQNTLNEKQSEEFKDTPLRALDKRSFIIKFFETKIILESIQKSLTLFGNLLFEFDKQLVNETLLEYLNNISNNLIFLRKKIGSFLFFFSIFFLFLSIFCATFFYIFLIFIFLNLLLFWLDIFTKIIETLFLNISCKIESYQKSNQKLIYFLREAELISLTNQRKYLIGKIRIKDETKTNFDQIECDRLNYKYRRQAFVVLKKHFLQLRRVNLVYFSEIKFTNVEALNLLSVIKPEELSNIFASRDIELDKLTDQFSIYCLKSITKFNNLLISESIKLVLIAYIDLLINSERFIIKSYKFLKNLVNIYIFMSKLTIELDELNEFSKLGNAKGKNVSFDKESDSLNKNEYKLQLETRNFLLNLYEFSRLKSETQKSKQLDLLKINFENCKFYFNGVLKKYESESETNSKVEQVENDESKTDIKKCDLIEEQTHLISDKDQAIIEDEILEADTSLHLKDENQNEIGQTNELDYFEKKELQLLNKNLFYELKYALKSKKNEWICREKIAKQKFNSKDIQTKEDNESFDIIQWNDEYLLENDFLKYKSSIRKRRKAEKIITEEKKPSSKYFYKPEMNEILSQSCLPTQHGFLSELIKKQLHFPENKLETLFESEN